MWRLRVLPPPSSPEGEREKIFKVAFFDNRNKVFKKSHWNSLEGRMVDYCLQFEPSFSHPRTFNQEDLVKGSNSKNYVLSG